MPTGIAEMESLCNQKNIGIGSDRWLTSRQLLFAALYSTSPSRHLYLDRQVVFDPAYPHPSRANRFLTCKVCSTPRAAIAQAQLAPVLRVVAPAGRPSPAQ